MAMPPPSPPSISPSQMTLLRIVSTMAWSDGHLADEEVGIMLDQFSHLFASNAQQQATLRDELRDYLMQNLPLEELVPKLTSQSERVLVLKLGHQVISASARSPHEASINEEEAAAYQRLVALLDLPTEMVQQVERQHNQDEQPDSLIDNLTTTLRTYLEDA
jgi:hypothetical protein